MTDAVGEGGGVRLSGGGSCCGFDGKDFIQNWWKIRSKCASGEMGGDCIHEVEDLGGDGRARDGEKTLEIEGLEWEVV